MIVLNRQKLYNVPFEQYLLLPGWSHSKIKNNGKTWTASTNKMILGTKVHNYLLEPGKYDHSDIDIVKPCAIALKSVIGPLWEYAETELIVTADFTLEGFCLEYVGRVDFGVPTILIVDFKISEVPLPVSIKRFGYYDQLNGYGEGYGVENRYLIRVNPKRPTDKPEIRKVPLNLEFWEYNIIQKGRPQL